MELMSNVLSYKTSLKYSHLFVDTTRWIVLKV